MPKVTLNDLGSGYASSALLDENFDTIETAFDNTLSRDGSTPNQMEADLDMNSNDVLNVASIDVASFSIDGTNITSSDASVSTLPTQTGHANQPLTTNGTAADWGRIHAEFVDYTSTEAGGSERTLRSRLEDTLDVRDFGVVGDGTTDDTVAFEAALDAAIAAGKTLTIPTSFVINITSAQILKEDVSVSIIGIGPGRARLKFSNATTDFDSALVFDISTKKLTTTMAKDHAVNWTELELSSTTGIVQGDLVQILSDASWYYETGTKAEIHRVVDDVDSGNIIDIDALYDGYDIGAETVTVNIYPEHYIHLENLEIELANPNTDSSGFTARRYSGGFIRNFHVYNAPRTGFGMNACLHVNLYDCFTHNTAGGTGGGIGYGFTFSGVHHSRAVDCRSENCRRGFEVTGGTNSVSRHVVVENFQSLGAGESNSGTEYSPTGTSPNFGFGTHGPADQIIFKGCKVGSHEYGVSIRGRNIRVEGCKFYGRMAAPIQLSHGQGAVIRDNEYYNGYSADGSTIFDNATTGWSNITFAQATNFIDILSTWDWGMTTVIADNRSYATRIGFIQLSSAVTAVTNLELRDNFCALNANTGSAEVFLIHSDGGTPTLDDSYIKNNTVRVLSGDYTKFDSDITVAGTANEVMNLGSPETYAVRIADDTAASISLGQQSGGVAVMIYGTSGGTPRGIILPVAASVSTRDFGTKTTNLVVSATAPLTGTTGADGDLTVSVESDGTLWLENRLGSSDVFYVTVFARI